MRSLILAALLGFATAKPIFDSGEHRLLRRQDAQEPAIVTIPSPVNHTGDVSACQGYRLTSANVRDGNNGVDGTLEIIGNCTAYGPDYPTLTLSVTYETENRLRVQITDQENKAHVVPNDVASWPEPGANSVSNDSSALSFEWEEEPFGFRIIRKSDGDVLFDTTNQTMIFEEQFVRFSSRLSEGSNIQGLGQHNDNFTYVHPEPDAPD